MAEIVRSLISDKPTLVDFADAQGRTSLMLASRGCRTAFWSVLHLCGRYEIESKYPVHTSATCRVFFATDLLESGLNEGDEDGSKGQGSTRVAGRSRRVPALAALTWLMASISQCTHALGTAEVIASESPIGEGLPTLTG